MTDHTQDITDLLARIEAAGADEKLTYEPQLSQLIAVMQAEGQAIPPEVRNVHEALLNDAIESQFDNLPV